MNADEIKLYPEMDKEIVGILRITDNPVDHYAANLIERLQAQLAAEAAKCEELNIFAAVHPADVTEVRRGEWKNVTGDGETAVCSLCGTLYDATPLKEQSKECFEAFKQFYNFCPNCGADMRGKEKAE